MCPYLRKILRNFSPKSGTCGSTAKVTVSSTKEHRMKKGKGGKGSGGKGGKGC